MPINFLFVKKVYKVGHLILRQQGILSKNSLVIGHTNNVCKKTG